MFETISRLCRGASERRGRESDIQMVRNGLKCSQQSPNLSPAEHLGCGEKGGSRHQNSANVMGRSLREMLPTLPWKYATKKEKRVSMCCEQSERSELVPVKLHAGIFWCFCRVRVFEKRPEFFIFFQNECLALGYINISRSQKTRNTSNFKLQRMFYLFSNSISFKASSSYSSPKKPLQQKQYF